MYGQNRQEYSVGQGWGARGWDTREERDNNDKDGKWQQHPNTNKGYLTFLLISCNTALIKHNLNACFKCLQAHILSTIQPFENHMDSEGLTCTNSVRSVPR